MNIIASRLGTQGLLEPKFKSPHEAVKFFGAVQAQEYLQAPWSIGMRVLNSKFEDIEKALDDRKIVRTWPMRGTLHYVAAEDVHWMVKLMAPRINRKMNSYYKKLGLDELEFLKIKKILITALEGGNQLTRPEIYKILGDHKIETKSQRGMFILGHFAQDSLICQGSRKGKQQTFTLLDEWVTKSNDLEGDEALGEITFRYFNSHGPAQIIDLMSWTSLTKTEVKIGIEQVKSRLIEETIGDRTFYSTENNTGTFKSPLLHLLPAYDEFTIAYRDRSDLISKENFNNIYVSNGFYSMISVDGKIVGTWKRDTSNERILISVNFFTGVDKQWQQPLEITAKLFGDFHSMKVDINYTKK
jgi:hypothetical protein